MAKVDLIDNSWVDLVFEGKNQEYGAYVLRKETGKRNVKALMWVIIGIAAIFADCLRQPGYPERHEAERYH